MSLTSDCLSGSFFLFSNDNWFYYVPMVSHCSISIACFWLRCLVCYSKWKQNPSLVFCENSRMWGELLRASECQAHWAKKIYWPCSVLLIEDSVVWSSRALLLWFSSEVGCTYSFFQLDILLIYSPPKILAHGFKGLF